MKKSRNLRGRNNIRIFKPVKLIVAEIIPTSACVAERGIGAIGAQMLTNTIVGAIEKKKPGSKLSKIVSPGMILLGLVGEATIQNRYAVAPFQGISSEGIRRTLVDNLPASIKTKMNLSGVGASYGSSKGGLTEADVMEAINELDKEHRRKNGTNGNPTGENFEGTLNGHDAD